MREVTFTAEDRIELTGHLFETDNPKSIFVIHPATGVPELYYEPFARWLCENQNACVLTYEYRDMANATPASMRASNTSMTDWGIHDQSAAVEFASVEFAGLQIHTIGHSLGGMCLPFHRNCEKVASHIAVNAGPAYWLSHPAGFMLQVILFWFLLGPLVTFLFGYMPGKLIGLNADLPREVYWQWRRWCINRQFFEIDWGKSIKHTDLTRVTCPVRLISTQDDLMIPPWQVKKLATYFPNADVEYFEISPQKFGLKSIGHIGIFSKRNRATWPEMLGSHRSN